MANATEIYSELVNFLANQLSLDSFHAWLVASAWDAPPNSPSWNLAGDIELALAEYSNGDISKLDLRKRLSEIGSVQHIGSREIATGTTASVVVRVPAGAQAA